MMAKNDEKIKEFLTKIISKKTSLGAKPKANYKTNCIIKLADDDRGVNLNTINSVDKCINLAAKAFLNKSMYSEACKFLEVPAKDSSKLSETNDILDDLKLRTKMIVWEIEKKNLGAMENKLKDLRSEDAKTEDALSDISKILEL